MDSLLEKCLFKREWAGACVNDVIDLVGSGKAHFTSSGPFASLVVKESHQGDVEGLPIAARTLLLNTHTNEIVVRGVNKFFDIEEVEQGLPLRDVYLGKLANVWLQRKMAGFVVTLFSLDGNSIGIASKHVVEGPHVDIARCVLEKLLSADQRGSFARDLFNMKAAVSCECISLADDAGHPVCEQGNFDEKLFIFSIHKRDSVQEVCLPLDAMRAIAVKWGIPLVPCWRCNNHKELEAWLDDRHRWEGRDPDGEPVAEGYVVVFEVPVRHVNSSVQITLPFTAVLVRLKAKTLRYRALRSLRSIALGESLARPLLLHEILVLWMERVTHCGCFRQAIKDQGVHRICTQFEAYIREHGNKRQRGGKLSVKQAFDDLLKYTEREVRAKWCAPLDVICLCGLPGVGKSTLSRTIADEGAQGHSAFRYVMHLCRDEIAKDVAKTCGIDHCSSKHKQRRLRTLVHQSMQYALDRLISLSHLLEGPGLLILDACNARPDTRRRWRQLLPNELKSFRLVHLTCADKSVLVSRVVERQDHPLLKDVSEAQAALYTVGKTFVAPLPSEPCIRLDTTESSAEELARSLLSLYTKEAMGGAAHHRRASIYGHREAEEGLRKLHESLAASIVGCCDDGVAALGREQIVKRNEASRKLIVVRLSLSYNELYEIVVVRIRSALDQCALPVVTWWGRLKKVFGFDTEKRPCVVEKGHTNWLRGWLFSGRDATETLSDGEWYHAIKERYDCRPSLPHVTLFYGSERSSPVVDVPHPGSAVDVILDSVLLDPFAMCLAVTVVRGGCRYEVQLPPGDPIPLHVTVGHARRVKPSYAGQMFSLFEQREIHNSELKEMQLNSSIKKSRSKFFNFVKVRFDTPVVVGGEVDFLQ
uniref:T4 RNA ligase 1-like N-terminal domain-containing protein n=1 Tax=Trypanosoma congolense (strain IL3000) TaxID=1068625 RepID=G0UX09_TRYCI|nr:conserved hypothetical protein [Trypanosoma congolense IL3000]